MIRTAFLAGAFIAAQATSTELDLTCLAAEERMMEFMVVEVENDPELDFSERAQTPEGRKEQVRELAIQMSEENPDTCALLLTMPDSVMRAFARATFHD